VEEEKEEGMVEGEEEDQEEVIHEPNKGNVLVLRRELSSQ